MDERSKPWPLIGHLLVAIPLAHFACSSIFLYSYCAGFGANISTFVAAPDIVNTSIRDMVLVYFVSSIMPAIFVVIRYSSGTPYAADENEKIADPDTRQTAISQLKRTRLLIIIMNIMIIGLLIVIEIQNYSRVGVISVTPVYWSLLIISQTVLPAFLRRFRIYGVKSEALSIVFQLVLASYFLGLSQGQHDRHIMYVDAYPNHVRCQQAALFRKIGDQYLAVLPDNNRVLLDKDCKIVFKIADAKLYGTLF